MDSPEWVEAIVALAYRRMVPEGPQCVESNTFGNQRPRVVSVPARERAMPGNQRTWVVRGPEHASRSYDSCW